MTERERYLKTISRYPNKKSWEEWKLVAKNCDYPIVIRACMD